MNHVYFNCRELQKLFERQWQRLKGILSQEVRAAQDNGGSHIVKLIHKTGNDAEQTSSTSNDSRSTIWNGSMDVIVETRTVTDIASVIDTTCETLTSLLDAGHGYRRYYVLLLEALLKLLTTLKYVERQQPDVLKNSGIFGQVKVSVSITYALVEKVSARMQVLIFFFKLRQLTCTSPDPLPEKLKAQVAETKRLLKEIERSLEIFDHNRNFHHITEPQAEVLEPVTAYGINKLKIVARHHRSLLRSGDKATFSILESNKILYIVQTWLNNPNSLFGSAKRLSASVKCSSGKVFSISVPGYPNKEVDPRNRTALIVSDLEEAQVRSFMPEDSRSSLRRPSRKAGSLLEKDQNSSSGKHWGKKQQKYAGELLQHSRPKRQKYRAEITMSNMVLKLDCIGKNVELERLSVEGKKHKTRVWYKCYVEETGEVIAIYRQRHRMLGHGRDDGIFHTIGIGNRPEVRDLIICSFVAMGVNSFL